jgi:hypothetical protein
MFYVKKFETNTETGMVLTSIAHKSKTKSGAVRKMKGLVERESMKMTPRRWAVTFALLTNEEYEAEYGVLVERENLMSGNKFLERRDTPGYLSPASEAYWSM